MTQHTNQNTRLATVHDIVRHLTTTATTKAKLMESPDLDGLDGVAHALNAAIDDGYVEASDDDRPLALAPGISYCQTCIEGCTHGTESSQGCGCMGCWSPCATNDCPGITYAELEMGAVPIV